MPEVPDHIVEELRQSVRVAFAPERMQPVDPFAHLSRHPIVVLRASRFDWRGMFGLIPWLIGAGIVIAGLLFVSQYGTGVKDRVVKDGNAAITHLLDAKDSIEKLDVDSAKTDLVQAQEAFDSASKELDLLGPTLLGILSHVPGLSSLHTGYAMLTAGKLLSSAGSALGDALDSLSTNGMSIGSSIEPLQEAFTNASKDLAKASALLTSVDADQVPEQYRAQFSDLQSRLPTIRTLVDRGTSTVAFLSKFTGIDRPQRYLVLFTNSSELRPTGGFPGSYGLLTFENGTVKEFHADDIYNPDGQISELIVPPIQLQHITPSWGMRDAAWWVDFPTSAKKVMQYWQKGGGAAVDGVLAIRPDVLSGILRITGAISLPNYDVVLTADNVLATLQQEVESNRTTAQPKQVIVDLAPLILQRLSSASTAQWAQLLGLFKDALDTRDITMYFNDEQMEQFVSGEKWSGAVQQTAGDFLMVDISNIKGAKSDAVTDSNVKLESWLENGTMVHRLTLTRRHNGGSNLYGFYNKTNYSWVRVLVPQGSVLRDIVGNDQPHNKLLMAYGATALRDPDLQALEATYQTDARGAVTYAESGKTGFGFWMTINPGTTETVQLEYEVPAKYVSSDYHLYVQRQPGLELTNFEFTLQKKGVLGVASAPPALTSWPDSWRLSDPLDRDLDLSVQIK